MRESVEEKFNTCCDEDRKTSSWIKTIQIIEISGIRLNIMKSASAILDGSKIVFFFLVSLDN